MACRYCLNAFCDDELTTDNDLSYIGVPIGDSDHRLVFRSGDGKKTGFLFEEFLYARWIYIGAFFPSFCPFCGRELVENKILKR